MNYIFVVYIALLSVQVSLQYEYYYFCARRSDGSCRYIQSVQALRKLNRHFKTKLRAWSFAAFIECLYVTGFNEISYCKSTCDDIRNNNYEKYDCSGKTVACAGNKKTGGCTVYDNHCSIMYDFCNNDMTDLFAAQSFRCTDNQLTQLGDTGECAEQNPNKTYPFPNFD